MGNYEDIIYLPHHRSKTRSHMSMQDRAAQFSPFAALTGFESAIEETGRITDSRPELLDYGQTLLDQAILQLQNQVSEQPLISVTYFVPDLLKSGGHLETVTAHFQKIDHYRQLLTMTDGKSIPLSEILQIDCPQITEVFESDIPFDCEIP